MASDLLTRDLFTQQPKPDTAPGSMDYSAAIARVMGAAIKRSPHDRVEICARMTRLTGKEISLHMLNAYTSEAREEYVISLQNAIAFDAATGGYALLNFFAERRGCTVNVGEEALLAELGHLEKQEIELQQKKKAIKAVIGKRQA